MAHPISDHSKIESGLMLRQITQKEMSKDHTNKARRRNNKALCARYREGATLALTHSSKLRASAEILYKTDPGSATFLLLTAWEEAHKALACALVAIDVMKATSIKKFFSSHQVKVLLSIWVLDGFEIRDSTLLVHGVDISELSLADWQGLERTYLKPCEEYMRIRNSHLYLNLGASDDWSVPAGFNEVEWQEYLARTHLLQILASTVMTERFYSFSNLKFVVLKSSTNPDAVNLLHTLRYDTN